MTIVATLEDRRTIAKSSLTAASRVDAGILVFNITMNDLRSVENILQFNFISDPDTYAVPQDASINQNVIGVTIYVGAGTTLSGEVIAVGI